MEDLLALLNKLNKVTRDTHYIRIFADGSGTIYDWSGHRHIFEFDNHDDAIYGLNAIIASRQEKQHET